MALQSVASENFTGTVATFTAGYAEPIGNFAVTIQWGDGTTTTGTVQQGPGDTYLVVGSHTYANAAQNVPVTVTIEDVLGNMTVVANSIMTVAGLIQPYPLS